MTEMMLGHVAQRDGHITLFGKDASRFKPHEATEGLAPLIVADISRVIGACRPGAGVAKRAGGAAGLGA